MPHEFATEQDLLERLTENSADIVYLVGSAVTAPSGPGEPGVPGVEGVIDMIRTIYEQGAKRDRFEAKLRAGHANRYQAAFQHLLATRDQDEANRIIRRCVVKARIRPPPDEQSLSTKVCRRLEDDIGGWHLPAAVKALGQILAATEPGARPIVLTSNFDPLVSVSVRSAGGSAFTVALQGDGSFSGLDGRGCMVVHFHGDWYRTDTLHVPTQLGWGRAKLDASLAHLLGERTLVVLGYSGWDDVFTRSLAKVIAGEHAKIRVVWTFRGEDEQEIRRKYGALLAHLDHPTGRVTLYKGIDVHRFMPRLRDELAADHRPPTPDISPATSPSHPPDPLHPRDSSRPPIPSQPPGLGYDPRWYVTRDSQETQAIDLLTNHGGLLVASAPMGGKSTFIHAVIARLHETSQQKFCVIHVGLGDLSERALENPTQCFRELIDLSAQRHALELRERFGEEAGDIEEWLASKLQQAAKRHERNLGPLFGELLHKFLRRATASGRTVVLVLDRFERLLCQKNVGLPVARALRARRETSSARGDPLSLLLGASGTNLHTTGIDAVSELAGVCQPIHLHGFTRAELARLAGIYGLQWTDEQLDELHLRFGGHPYFTRLILYLDARGTPRRALLDDAAYGYPYCGAKLKELWLTCELQPPLQAALCSLVKGQAVS